MTNKPTKHLCLKMDEAAKELNSAIEQIAAKHDLPCYLLEPIVSDILTRLQNGKRVELENARKTYEAQLAEWEKKEGANDNGE